MKFNELKVGMLLGDISLRDTKYYIEEIIELFSDRAKCRALVYMDGSKLIDRILYKRNNEFGLMEPVNELNFKRNIIKIILG